MKTPETCFPGLFPYQMGFRTASPFVEGGERPFSPLKFVMPACKYAGQAYIPTHAGPRPGIYKRSEETLWPDKVERTSST